MLRRTVSLVLQIQFFKSRQTLTVRSGYATCFPEATDYDLQGAPLTWARVPAMRHALALYPYSTYFFHLDQTALVMNPSLTVEDHIMSRPRLESLMLKDQPIVPPESVIKTFSHLRGDRVDLVLTQDGDGLSQTSFILRQGDWAKFFLDTWFDPLYRSYNFQKAEAHALVSPSAMLSLLVYLSDLVILQEHIVQWHSTILTKLALIPQRTMNAYSQNRATDKASSLFGRDDFVITFSGCDDPEEKKRSCDSEIEPFWKLWQQKVGKSS